MLGIRRILPYFLAVLLFALTYSLGRWQLRRAAEKEAQLAQIRAQASMPQQELNPAQTKPYQRVILSGVWQHEMTQYLDNRPNERGQAGIEVITPLCLSPGLPRLEQKKCRSPLLLVNRGWLARDFQQRDRLTPFTTSKKPVAFEGMVLQHFSRVYAFQAEKDHQHPPLRQNLTPTIFRQIFAVETYPFVVRQQTESYATKTCLGAKNKAELQTKTLCQPIADGLLRLRQKTASELPRHYGYAVQWFALATLIASLACGFAVHAYRNQGPFTH
jgi:surfeit locus 1 family protein